MKLLCKYDELIPIDQLKDYPRNRNNHSKDQISRLAKLLAHHGVRAPIIVSTLSDCIVKGHGTRDAFKKNKWKECPVVFQDFDSEEDEFAFVQSDNAIASWSQLDLTQIHTDLSDLGPFDLDLLGIENFTLDPPQEKKTEKEKKDKKSVQCPNCGEQFTP